MKRSYFLSFLFLSLFLLQAKGQSVIETPYYPMLNWDTSPYKSYRYTRADKEWMNFRLLFPNGYDSTAADGQEYPLIIVLHGGGESARMEWNNTTKSNTPYPAGDPRRDNNDHHLFFGGKEHLEAVQRNRFPGFVLFPQNFYGIWVNGNGDAETPIYKDLEVALDLLEYLTEELKVDPNRIYIHGLSKGGNGTWYAAWKRPHLFAAALPMSAPGDPAMAEELSSLPLWVFQGEEDKSPSPAHTKRTINAIREAGGYVRYKEYEGRGHNTWNLAYRERDFFEWMLNQSKDGTPPSNIGPVADAGENQNLSLPANSTSFTASAYDPDGTVVSWLWEQTEGPQVTLSGMETSTLEVSDLVTGTYAFKVTVTDNDGATASDEVKLNVAANSGTDGDEDGSGGDEANEGEEGEDDDHEGEDKEEGENEQPLGLKYDEGEDFYGVNISAYPNPFNRYVKVEIETPAAQTYQVSLLDPKGVVLHTSSIKTQVSGNNVLTIELPQNDLNGYYYIQVWNKAGKIKKAFMLVKE